MVSGIFLAFYSSVGGGVIGNILFQWEQAGVFAYVLPFLLIFAVVFGILAKTNIFGSRNGKSNVGINVVISLAVGFLALQFNFVSLFFAEIFPRLGIGISIVLVVLILLGLFINPKNKGWMMGLSAVALLIAVVVVFASLDSYSWYSGSGIGYWLGYNWATIVGILVFVGLLIAIIVGSKSGNNNQGYQDGSLLGQMLAGGQNKP